MIGFDDLFTSALGLSEGEAPFPWQAALLDRFMKNGIPRALDIPTGLGKTAIMGIWIVARAQGADVPRRLVYVVDRRAVVDQATMEAERIRNWVESQPHMKE
ncbi:MAG: DEAD/DEAH box helicase family protein, partial [bacterium]